MVVVSLTVAVRLLEAIAFFVLFCFFFFFSLASILQFPPQTDFRELVVLDTNLHESIKQVRLQTRPQPALDVFHGTRAMHHLQG